MTMEAIDVLRWDMISATSLSYVRMDFRSDLVPVWICGATGTAVVGNGFLSGKGTGSATGTGCREGAGEMPAEKDPAGGADGVGSGATGDCGVIRLIGPDGIVEESDFVSVSDTGEMLRSGVMSKTFPVGTGVSESN